MCGISFRGQEIVTAAGHRLYARITQHLPGIFRGSSEVDRPPALEPSGPGQWEGSRLGLPTAQECNRSGGDRNVGRIGAVVREGQGFGFASLHLLLKETTQNNLTLNSQTQYASCRPGCPHEKPRKNLEFVQLKMETLRPTDMMGVA